MTEQLKIHVDGRWRASASDEYVDVYDPTYDRVVAAAPAGDGADVEAAVAAAKRAFVSWSTTAVEDRAAILENIGETISAHKEELAEAAATDIGTPLPLGQIMHSDLPASTFADMAERIRTFPFEQDGTFVTVREPVGVVGAIAPWNFPAHLISAKVAPALAAGCTVVVKPSEVAPLSAWLIADIIATSGLPPGVFNLVSGVGPVVGQALAQHPDTDMLSFTGSMRGGRAVAHAAAEGIKKVTLELGGKSANVILDDVDDLSEIMPHALDEAMGNSSGQQCSALTRLIVPRDRLAEVEELLAEAVKAFVVGDPKAEGTVVGPLVSRAQLERVRGYIATGKAEGPKLVVGGDESPDTGLPGYFVAPTVFSEVTTEMTIAREEIFGPVLAVMAHDGDDDAVRMANATRYGLSGAVWAADRDRASAVARRLRTGQVHVNGGAYVRTAPFGGYGFSGLGRELGGHGLEEYFETKAIMY